MAENSKIEWTTHTFNPWRGCTKVSAGCANCYADSQAKINPRILGIWGANGTRVVASEAKWNEPLKWNREAENYGDWFCPSCKDYLSGSRVTNDEKCDTCGTDVEFHKERPRIFCASMADIFEDWPGRMKDASGLELWGNKYTTEIGWEPDKGQQDFAAHHTPVTMQDVRNRFYRLIDKTLNVDYLLVTKRPENAPKMIPPGCQPHFGNCKRAPNHKGQHSQVIEPRSNVWYGTSVENQQAADQRIPHLLNIPAKIRFLSVEPLLGPIKFDNGFAVRDHPWVENGEPAGISPGIDWVIVGGESGQNARPCQIEWIRDIVKQCRAAGIPVFVKQLGSLSVTGNIEDEHHRMKWIHPKGGDINEWPDDLRIREFPNV